MACLLLFSSLGLQVRRGPAFDARSVPEVPDVAALIGGRCFRKVCDLGACKVPLALPRLSDRRCFPEAMQRDDPLEPDNAALRSLVALQRLQRGTGVIYRPDTERQSHFYTRLAQQFDAAIHIDETSAV